MIQTLIPPVLAQAIFGAFSTLPHNHNNFGVSSFIYLLCFFYLMKPKGGTCTVVFGLQVNAKMTGCLSACVPIYE